MDPARWGEIISGVAVLAGSGGWIGSRARAKKTSAETRNLNSKTEDMVVSTTGKALSIVGSTLDQMDLRMRHLTADLNQMRDKLEQTRALYEQAQEENAEKDLKIQALVDENKSLKSKLGES